MRQNICHGYFAFGRTQMVDVVTELWLSLYFTQRRQKNTKSLPALKLDVTVSYVGLAVQICHVF